MKKYLCYFLVVLIFGLVGCLKSELDEKKKLDKKVENLLPQNENGNFVLYVSNQSFAQTPIDVTIHINGKRAISSEFNVGNQHNWVKHIFSLQPGKHKLIIASNQGEATLEKEFEINGKRWSAIAYWYYPKKDGKKHFSFQIQNKPIYFR